MKSALVIEDDYPIRLFLDRLLTAYHFSVDEAYNGIQAIDLINHKNYDLITLDMMMAPTGGFEVLDYIKTQHPAEMGKIIVVSAMNESSLKKINNYDVQAVLQKPFDIFELQRRIKYVTS
jgi:DNA-binding response OmpR family regulator